jgi:NAD(P)-dependent dehydrogenase (short-subunit alcohol dehydrogenase family)
MDLNDKVGVVTGAAGGIGEAVARRFARAGAAVVLGDVRHERGEAVAAAIRAEGGRARYVAHDASKEDGWERILVAAIAEFGGLDVLVNNAAIEKTCLLENVTAADIEALMAVNVVGVLFGHKHAARRMKPGGAAGRGGSIVNLSSVAGLIGTPGLGVYSASKGAVRLLTKAAAVEFGRLGYGIRVNSIHPGLVETEMGTKLLGDFVALGMFKDMDEAYVQMKAASPLGVTSKPQDIANAALYLASGSARTVSGTELVCDGAMTAS